MNLLKKDTRDESEEIIVIENISNLQQMHLGYYLENNVVLIDCSLKEEFEHMEKVVNEIFYNNKTILAHIIVLNNLYYDSSLDHIIFLSDDTDTTKLNMLKEKINDIKTYGQDIIRANLLY